MVSISTGRYFELQNYIEEYRVNTDDEFNINMLRMLCSNWSNVHPMGIGAHMI